MLLEDTSQELDIKVVSQTHVLHPRARLVSLCTHARGPYHPFPHLLPSWGPALTVLLGHSLPTVCSPGSAQWVPALLVPAWGQSLPEGSRAVWFLGRCWKLLWGICAPFPG
jgi:hypothetical protein